jgi:small subunit ribosomal protein S16
MVRIRLRRVGLKAQPSYRVVVTDQRSPRNGSFIEIIGFNNPRTQPITDIIDEARALHWLKVGAQPSEAALTILKRTGTMARFARLRKGEDMEVLVAEAKAAEAARTINPKTRYDAPIGKPAAVESDAADAVDAAE